MAVPTEPVTVTAAPIVLVIEDNISDVFLLERALHKQNYESNSFVWRTETRPLPSFTGMGSDSQFAVPNLILLDLNLPKHSGDYILREIRGARHLSGIPVCAEVLPSLSKIRRSSRNWEWPDSSPNQWA